jgi:diguanylate cyclase (GGDEF)-like protein
MNETEHNVAADPAATPETIADRIRALDGRDLQLWCIGGLILSVVGAGLLALLMPQLLWNFGTVVAKDTNAPQLFFGLIALLILSNTYLFSQRLMLVGTRRELIVQLQEAERNARTDSLTGLFNRRWLDEVLAREISRAERSGAQLTLMLADLDGFKAINTRLGHVGGDNMLTEVARLLRRNFRAADYVVRYGGDEFIAIMPDTDRAQAQVAVNRLHGFEEARNTRVDADMELHLSCGLASFTSGMSVQDLVDAADRDMYLQKPRTREKATTLRSPL